MSRNQRVVVLGLAVVVLVVAVVVIGTGGSSNSTKDAGPTTVVVQGAKPVGGVKDVTFKKGGTVDLTVKSDTADEVHFHGYDVHKDVAKGGSVHFSVPGHHRGQVRRRARGPQADAGQRDGRPMSRRLVRSASALASLGLLASAALPASASAHGLVGKQDLPIPRWLFAWAAAVVLVVSFVALAVLWPRPRLERRRRARACWRAPVGPRGAVRRRWASPPS